MSVTPRFLCGCALLLVGCFNTVQSDSPVSGDEAAKLTSFSYEDWTRILASHVDSDGRVDYPALKANRLPLDRFVGLIGSVGPKSRPALFPTRAHRLAYYINAYNALTMFNVINRLPGLKRVIDDKFDFFYFTKFPLDGGEISLYALENDVIRPDFGEPRIHFALNCASVGCPQLPARPFLPTSLKQQLAVETHKFISDARNVAVHNGQVVLSEIFEWYAKDFPPNPVTWINDVTTDLKLPQHLPVSYRPYNWALNAQAF
ncbi:MAG: DUF547 domain-containing protein [Myxococcota bacterium]|nr:DUF547 domain-containing protein [Myxococcota bacterium]